MAEGISIKIEQDAKDVVERIAGAFGNNQTWTLGRMIRTYTADRWVQIIHADTCEREGCAKIGDSGTNCLAGASVPTKAANEESLAAQQ